MAKNKYSVSYTKKLNKLLQKPIHNILETTGVDISNKVKEYIQRYWYDTYEPKDYERTKSLLEAVSFKIEGNSVIVYIDEKKFVHSTQEGWSQHRGFDGVNFSEGLIQFVENGVYNS